MYAQNKSAVSRAVKLLAFTALVFLMSSGKVLAQPGPLLPGRQEIVDGIPTLKGGEAIFENIISVALLFAGIVLFVMFVIGGFRYMTAGGDPKAVEGAKGTLTHAIAGLVVLILAYIIIQFVSVLTGVCLNMFTIYHRGSPLTGC